MPNHNKRILLVEDDFMNMRLVQHVLETEGYTVIGAANAREALKQLESSPPDLILMDLQLPDMDGVALVRLVREKAMTRDIAILAITAHAMKGDRERILKTGCNGYIAKPINVREFVKTVRSYLGSRN